MLFGTQQQDLFGNKTHFKIQFCLSVTGLSVYQISIILVLINRESYNYNYPMLSIIKIKVCRLW